MTAGKPETRGGQQLMVNYSIEGLGHAPAFKNSKRLITIKGRPSMITKPEFKQWMQTAIMMLRPQVKRSAETARAWQKRDTPKGKDRLSVENRLGVCVQVGLGYSSLKAPDITGALETVMDCLRDAGAIADDSPRYIRAAAVRWYPVEVGREFVQVGITID